MKNEKMTKAIITGIIAGIEHAEETGSEYPIGEIAEVTAKHIAEAGKQAITEYAIGAEIIDEITATGEWEDIIEGIWEAYEAMGRDMGATIE